MRPGHTAGSKAVGTAPRRSRGRSGKHIVSGFGRWKRAGSCGRLNVLDDIGGLLGVGILERTLPHRTFAEIHKAEAEELTALPKSVVWTVTTVITGLLLLIGGSQVLLEGAVGIAEHFGVSEAVIGLTLVAVGTSLPELSISVIAALRRHADVAVGNILCSNIFNLLGILGVSALLQPLPVHARILQFDQWVMLGSSLLLLLFLYTGRHLSRLEGGVLMAGYGVYLGLSFTKYGG